MIKFKSAKLPMAASIIVASALLTVGCSKENEVKAVDRTEEAAAQARVKALEAQAQALEAGMPEANSPLEPVGSDASASKATIKMPDESTIPDDEQGAAIRRGLLLVNNTYKELPDHVGNRLNCTSCHLANGSEAYAAPWNGLPGIFPIYRSRNANISSLQQRVNGCFERSMNGKALDPTSDDMNAIMAYMAWLSQGIPAGVSPEGRGFVKVDTDLEPNPENGKKLFAEKCSVCHGENGEGQYKEDGSYIYPAVAGPDSFNDGAGMARTYKAAAFIKGKMPFGQGNSLSDQEAVDIAAYFTHLDRPVKANKDKDWPKGGAPKDVRR